MEINDITKIHYIGAFFNDNQNIVQIGDVMTFSSHFKALLNGNTLDFAINYQKIYSNKDRNCTYNVKILDNVAYCIIFTGLTRISDNCMNELIGHQNDIISAQTTRELFLLEKDFKILLDFYNTPENDKMYEVKEKIRDVTDTMRDAVNNALRRGQTIEEIEVKVDTLENKVNDFNNETKQVKNKMCLSNVKATVMILMVILCIFIILALLGYGAYKIIII
mgnify:CR=1 FL=1